LKGNSPSRPIVIYGIVALALISMIYLVTEQVFSSSAIQGEKIKGVSLVAPPQPFQQDPFAAIQKINANAVAIMPYAFSVPGNGEVIYNHPRQWWGERKEGTIETIVKAKEAGMKIEWCAGGFVWKWYAHHEASGGPNNNDYTPQNKPAQKVIELWYGPQP
jgi:hypothetical protein